MTVNGQTFPKLFKKVQRAESMRCVGHLWPLPPKMMDCRPSLSDPLFLCFERPLWFQPDAGWENISQLG